MAKGKFSGGMPGNMNNMLRQAQKMQQDMLKAQQELEEKEYEAAAGGGAVTVKVSGKKELIDVAISPDVVDPDDIEMLQDLIMAAVNEALRKAEESSAAELGKLTGGFSIPGLF
ncbi:MAG: YbaB/EbfC family nucleoid-associated protein [Clostridia bacterium]|nr:YbaB/EbfC family nucleoid-associated protein [Clostridia bacterium]